MKKKNENNKSKVIGFGILALLLTSAVVVTPILVKYFGKNNDNANANTNVDKSKLELWTKNNTDGTQNLDSLLATNSKSLTENLVKEGIVSSEFANEIKSVKFVYSKNNYQLNSDKVKVDLIVETNDGSTNETVYGIPTSVNIVNFDTNKFINELQQIEISDLNTSLGTANIRNTIYNMNVGFAQDSLQNVTVSESARNNAIIKNSFSPFASTTDCVYKLDFTYNTTNDYVFNTNTSTFGAPNFTNTTNLNNCITKPINTVTFNDTELKSEIEKINDYNSINDLLTNQDSLINLVDKSNIVANNDWISSSNITVSENSQHKLAANVEVTLINGQTHTATINTNINVVTFNKDLFKEKMLNETNSNNLVLANFVNTLKSMSVISNNSAINVNSTTADPLDFYRESNGNKYNIYNVDIALNSNSVFLNGNSVSNSISLKNVDTSIPETVNINKNILEVAVANATGSKAAYDSFIAKNSTDLETFLIGSNALNIADPATVIQSVAVSPITPSSTDEFVKVKLTVNFASSINNNTPTTLIVNTGLRIVRILENNILTYFKTSVNNDSQINDQLETSLIASNANLTSNNLKTISASPSNPNFAENDLNHLPCKVFDLNITLNDGYVYLDGSNQIQTKKSIPNVLTSIATNAQLNTTQLTQAIQNIDNVNKLNSMLNDKLGFVKQNITVSNQNLISNVELTPENNSGIIAIKGSIQLTNGQIIDISKTNTTLKVVNFNQQTFNTYIKTNVNQSSQLNSTNIKSTINSSNSGLNNTNLKSATATAHQTPTVDPDRHNSYFQYDFTFNLQDGYCFYDNPSSITDTNTLNNVFTSIIHNATISNVDTVISEIKQNASSISNLHDLLNNQQKIEEIVKNAHIVSDNNLIKTVKLTDVTTESDTNVTLQLIVTLTTGQDAINQKIPTNIKIVKINQDSLKLYFQKSVTTESMINNSNLINTLYSSNGSGSGIINNCLANTTSIAPTKYIYQNLPGTNIPYYKYNLTLNLSNGYCFYNFSNKQLTSTQTITEVLSGIKYDINPNSATLQTKLNNINSYSQLLQYSKNTSNSLLKLVKGTTGYVDKDYWVRSVENITLTNVGNKVNISFDVRFSTDKVVNVSATTNVTILAFNNKTFTNAIGKVNTETDLNNSAKLKKLIESSLSVTTSGTVSNATSQRLSDYYTDSSTRINYYKYNFAFTVADQYCFFNNNNGTISNKKNLNSEYKTNIIVPNLIDAQFDLFINKLQNMTLEEGTDCFTNIFEGTDYSEPSTWRLKNDIVKTITGLDMQSVFKRIPSIQNVSSDPSNGMITFRISAELNTPYQYKGSTTINQQVLTKTYDPNSEYNKSLFIFDGASCIRGVSSVYTSKRPQTLYFPKSCTSINCPNGSRFEGNVVSSKLDFRFSKIANIISGSTFRNNSSIVNITFNGNKNFLFSGNNNNKYNFAEMSNLASVDLSNTLINNIPEGTFQNNPRLSRVALSGCQYLSTIYNYAFYNCPALTELDFSSCTLTSVGINAFQNCIGLRKVYVKDEASYKLIFNALSFAGFYNVSIKIGAPN